MFVRSYAKKKPRELSTIGGGWSGVERVVIKWGAVEEGAWDAPMDKIYYRYTGDIIFNRARKNKTGG